MLPVVGLSLISLLDRAISGLVQSDSATLYEVLADCSRAEAPGSPEEFSRALSRQAVFEKVIEQTGRNLRLLRGEDAIYGRNAGGNS